MSNSANQPQIEALKVAIALTHDVSNHPDAQAAFTAIRQSVADGNPQAAEMMDMLWQEITSLQRSVNFWQEISQVEKNLSERITENHIQLKQNYMRLMQEQ
ncbi:MAG: hypothetical protein AAF728_11340 [Cyanobacteria bacterium P01_D01_bin.128]